MTKTKIEFEDSKFTVASNPACYGATKVSLNHPNCPTREELTLFCSAYSAMQEEIAILENP